MINNIDKFYKHLEEKRSDLIKHSKLYYGYNYDIDHIMIFIWQQSTAEFNRLFKGTEYLDYLLTKFVKPSDSDRFYRGIKLKGKELRKDSILVASSTNVEVATKFAFDKNEFKGFVGCYTAEKILDCKPYGIVDNEDEVILYKPQLLFKVDFIKLEEVNERV